MKVKTIKEKPLVPAWKNKWVSGALNNNDYSGDLRALSLNGMERNKHDSQVTNKLYYH